MAQDGNGAVRRRRGARLRRRSRRRPRCFVEGRRRRDPEGLTECPTGTSPGTRSRTRGPYDGGLDAGRGCALVVAGAQPAWAGARRRAARRSRAVHRRGRPARPRRAGGTSSWPCATARRGARRTAPASPPGRRRRRRGRWSSTPAAGDLVVDAAGIDGFYGSALDDELRGAGRRPPRARRLRRRGRRRLHPAHAPTTGATSASSLTDARGAVRRRHSARRALSSITMSGGIFGAIGTTDRAARRAVAAAPRP